MAEEKEKEKELNADQLNEVAGGSIDDVVYTQTKDIAEEIKGKI